MGQVPGMIEPAMNLVGPKWDNKWVLIPHHLFNLMIS